MDLQLPEIFRFLASVARLDAGLRYVDSAANWISSQYGISSQTARALITELENHGYGNLDSSGTRFTLKPEDKLVSDKVGAYFVRQREQGYTQGDNQVSSQHRPSALPRSLEDFLEATASYYRMKLQELLAHSRKQPLARRRQVAMYLMKTDGGFSLPAIGDFMRRDHTTVLHACRNIEKLRISDPSIAADLASIRKLITST
jgi:hypothetical protein